MFRKLVNSSNLYEIGYDKDNQLLEITFQTGVIYHYFSVSEEVYRGLLESKSHGKYFNKFIRNGYKYKLIGHILRR